MTYDVAEAASTGFPDSYASARAAFRAAADARAYSCVAIGPNAETLWTDAAWIGSTDAQDVLVVLAGVRGVEGPAPAARHP